MRTARLTDPGVAGRVAAIDCGTNSLRLLVSARRADGTHVDLVRETRIARLGAGVDRTGRLAPAALERARSVLADYAELIAQHSVDLVQVVATSAVRDAANRDAFTAMVESTVGVRPQVISGAEEARLSFAGAVADLDGAGDVLVLDVGGGSTELVLGTRGGGVCAAHSMDVGSVRLTDRHLSDDPPSSAQVNAACRDIDRALDGATRTMPVDRGRPVIGVAGTVLTLSAIALGLDRYDTAVVHGATVDAGILVELCDRLLRMTRAQRASIPVIAPGRVDVIGAGALIVAAILQRTNAPALRASEHDILDGVAQQLFDDGAE